MKNLIIIAALIFISCKNEQKTEKGIPKEIPNSEQELIIQKTESESTIMEDSNHIELDSIWVNEIFKNTSLTSDSGEFYSGLKSKIYKLSSNSIKNKKLNTYLKKVDAPEGILTEIFAVLLSENEEELYDIKWIGNIGQLLECEMNTEINPNQNGLIAEYSFLCYDGYDEKLDKEFMANKITVSEIIIEQNLLKVKRDTLTKKTELK